MDASSSSTAVGSNARESDEAPYHDLEEDSASSVDVGPTDQKQDNTSTEAQGTTQGKGQGEIVDIQQAKSSYPSPPFLSDDDDVQVLHVVVKVPHDEKNIPKHDIYGASPPQITSDQHNTDASRIVISTDASLKLTAGGACVILNDVTFGTQTRVFSIEPTKDSEVAERATMTAAVRWGCQLVERQRRDGDHRIKIIQVVCDCRPAVRWWNGRKPLGQQAVYSSLPFKNPSPSPPTHFDHERDALNVAIRAVSLGISVRAVWEPACSTVGIQLADWLSRLAKDFEVVVLRGGDMTELTGLKFDLFKGMSLPNGRVATIRYMGGYLREKIGFNFHQLVSCRVEVPQIAGTKRKHVPDEAEAEPPAEKERVYIVISDVEEDNESEDEKENQDPKEVAKAGQDPQTQQIVSSGGVVRQYIDLTLD